MSNEAYTEPQFEALLHDSGFEDVRFVPSLIGTEDASQAYNLVIHAEKLGE